MYAFGSLCNFIALAANGGQMPVLWPGGCSNFVVADDDIIHKCMNASTHLKFLCDIAIINHLGVFSIGDGFLLLGIYLTWPCLLLWSGFVIKDYSEKR